MKTTKRFIRVWQRNLKVYQKTWRINFIPPLLEPIFYILAFGLGVGSMVGEIKYNGIIFSYIQFIAPAIISITIMFNAFFENTYASFVRMYYQKTFDSLMTTPLCLEDIITGEIVWGATKALIAAVIMMLILSIFGLIHFPTGLLLIPLSFLGGIGFGSIGMCFTGILPNIETFNLPVFLFITPMFLFSETFFPLSNLPLWAQRLSLISPLTHLVRCCRSFTFGVIDYEIVYHIFYLILLFIIFFPLAISKMRKRLIN